MKGSSINKSGTDYRSNLVGCIFYLFGLVGGAILVTWLLYILLLQGGRKDAVDAFIKIILLGPIIGGVLGAIIVNVIINKRKKQK